MVEAAVSRTHPDHVVLEKVVPAQVLDRAVASVVNSRLQRARASLSLRPSPLNLIH